MMVDVKNKMDISVDEILSIVKKHSLNITKETIENITNYIIKNYDIGRIRFSIAPKPTGNKTDNRLICQEDVTLSAEKEQATLKSKINGFKESALKFFLKKELEDNLAENFADKLFNYIDAKGLTDAEVYKRVNIDRRLFSKFRTSKEYNPSRDTAIKLAIALELDLHETESLIEKAGYALGNSNKRDLIIKYFIENGIYNLAILNEMLFAFEENTLD